VTALLHEPADQAELTAAGDTELPDAAAAEEPGSVVLCGW